MNQSCLLSMRALLFLIFTFGYVGTVHAADGSSPRSQKTKAKRGNNTPISPDIYAKVLPSVASLHIEGPLHVHSGKKGKIHPSKSRGTGFFIDETGLMITNQHVIQTARKIEVVFDAGHRRTAEVVGSDVSTDVALLKVNCEGLDITPLSFENSDELEIGEPVFAIGHPLGLQQSASSGIISALHRHEIRPRKEHRYSDFIQTDAAINKGSSGGPLFNREGRVIGMNTAIKKKGRGLAFSIPSNMITQLLPHLKKGRVPRSWLGVSVAAADPLEMPREGIQLDIKRVIAESPAEKAGLKAGDIIEKIDGQPIISADTFAWKTGIKGEGAVIRLEILRQDSTTPVELEVELELKPTSKHKTKKPILIYEADDISKFWGISFKVDNEGGLRIQDVKSGSPAEKMGLQTDDEILRLGDDEKRTEEGALRAAIRSSKSAVIELEVQRNNRRYYIPVKSIPSTNP